MVRELPTFRGYTVDLRLREFRLSCPECHGIKFISFDSEEGNHLLMEVSAFYKAGGTLFFTEHEDGELKVIPIALSTMSRSEAKLPKIIGMKTPQLRRSMVSDTS